MDTPATRLTLLALLKADPTSDEAWRQFVARYGPKVVEWVRLRGLPTALAEECSQDVLVSLFRALRTFEYDPARGRFRGYLHTVVKRSAIAALKRVPRQPTQEAPLEAAAEVDLCDRLAEEFDLERLRVAMKHVEARMQPATWRAFVATELEGRRASEVGSELGLPTATINVYRSRVRAAIKQELEWLDGKPQQEH